MEKKQFDLGMEFAINIKTSDGLEDWVVEHSNIIKDDTYQLIMRDVADYVDNDYEGE